MIAQYTAAGIVAENRRLASPASVDSVPTSGMQEDHVSMGWAATRKLRTVLDNLTSLLAVELLAAVRALQLRAPMVPSPAGRAGDRGADAVRRRPGPGHLPRAGAGGGAGRWSPDPSCGARSNPPSAP